MNLAQVREKYPQYKDVSDQKLAEGLHKKYYSDVPFSEFASKIGYAPAVAGEKKWHDPSGLARTALGQGLAMGWGDEAEALFRSKVLRQGGYDENVNKIRADVERYKKDNPNVALGAEIAGGALPIVATMGAAALPSLALRGASTAAAKLAAKGAGGFAKNAAIGAGYGAVSGAGGAEGDWKDRLAGGAVGAGIGGVGGAVLPKLVTGLGHGAIQAKRFLTPNSSAATGAEEKIIRALAEGDVDMPKLKAIMQRDRELGVPTRLLDATQGTTDLATGVASLPGAGRKTIIESMQPRIENARSRVATRSHKEIGGNQNFAQKEDALIKKLRTNAKKSYEKAYAHGDVTDNNIRRYLEDSDFQKAFVSAKEIADSEARHAKLRGEDPSKYELKKIFGQDQNGEWVQTGVIPDVRTLDYMKRGLDAMIAREWSAGEPARAIALKDSKNLFLQELDKAVPAYGKARKDYRGDSEMQDALRFGREDLFKAELSPDQLKREMAGMSKAELEVLRVGAAEKLNATLGSQKRKTNAASTVFGADYDQAKIKMLFGNEKKFNDFSEAMKRESQLFEHSGQVYQGSQTAQRRAMQKDVSSGDSILGETFGAATDAASLNVPGVAGRIDRLAQRADYPQRRTEELGNLLATPADDEAAINALVGRLEKRESGLGQRNARFAGVESAVNPAQAGALSKTGPYGYAEEEYEEPSKGGLP